MKIWLPDHEAVSVEWYIEKDSKLARGVESIREDWIPKELSKRPRAGFAVDRDDLDDPGDPERDEWMW